MKKIGQREGRIIIKGIQHVTLVNGDVDALKACHEVLEFARKTLEAHGEVVPPYPPKTVVQHEATTREVKSSETLDRKERGGSTRRA